MKQRLIRYFFGITNIRLAITCQGGGKLTAVPTDEVQVGILLRGAYEPEVWEALAAHASAQDVFWDVGANVGGVSLVAAYSGRVRQVHAFEPHPVTLGLLAHHVSLNPKSPAPITAHGFALGRRAEQLHLTSGPIGNTGAATLRPGGQSESFEVACRTVDEVVESGTAPAPDIMKMDVEGWELQVLQGATALFERHPPKAIVLESAAKEDGSPRDRELFEFLEQRGYAWTHLRRPKGNVEPNENYVFVRGAAAG